MISIATNANSILRRLPNEQSALTRKPKKPSLGSHRKYRLKSKRETRTQWHHSLKQYLFSLIPKPPSYRKKTGDYIGVNFLAEPYLLKDLKELLEALGGAKPNLTNANLSNVDLRVGSLSPFSVIWGNTNLSRANLTKVQLSSMDLQDTDLSGANLTEANLCEANLTRVNLTGANLTKTILKRAKLPDDPDLLQKAGNLQGVQIEDYRNRIINIKGLDLRGALLKGINFWEHGLDGTNLQGASLDIDSSQHLDPDWLRAATNVEGVSLHVDLTRTNLSGLNLRGAYFSGKLPQSTELLSNADFSYAHFMYTDLEGADLSVVNLHGADFVGAQVKDSTTLPYDASRVIDPESSVTFFEKVLDQEDKYKAYKEILKNLTVDSLTISLEDSIRHLIQNDKPSTGLLEAFSKTYYSTQGNNIAVNGQEENEVPKKTYGNFCRALDSLEAPDKQIGGVFNFLLKTIKLQDSNQRQKIITGLEPILQMPGEAKLSWLKVLANCNSEERLFIFDKLSFFQKIALIDQVVFNDYLSLKSKLMRDTIDSYIQTSDKPQALIELILRNSNSFTEDHLARLSELFEIDVDQTKRTNQKKQYILGQLRKLSQEPREGFIDAVKQFAVEYELQPTDNMRQDVFNKYLPEILTSSNLEQRAYAQTIENLSFLGNDSELKVGLVQQFTDNADISRTVLLLAYLKDSQRRNPAVMSSIYPIIKPVLVNPNDLTDEDNQQINNKLFADFNNRFYQKYHFSWSRKMKELHKDFKPENLKHGFKIDIDGGYTVEALNAAESIFNGENVSDLQCTSKPGTSNGHLQLGLVGTGNTIWMRIRNADGQIVSGFDVRVKLDGSFEVGPQYAYNNMQKLPARSFKQNLINQYAQHIGVSHVSANIETVDPDIGNLGDVLSYMENGKTYIPQN